jgi:hypothetical protein
MRIPEGTKPVIWGAIGGAIAAMVIGFSWGGWMTSGTAGQLASDNAEAAVVQVLTPLCVAKAEGELDMLQELKAESRFKRDDYVIEAGWVDSVSQKYRSDVATNCAETLVEGMAAD